jgi:hypothetical protein
VVSGQSRSDVPYAQIVRIDRPHDGLANGARIGFASGAALGLLAIAADDARECSSDVWFDCSNPTAGAYALGTLVTGGLGAAIGVGIDALIHHDRTIYRPWR